MDKSPTLSASLLGTKTQVPSLRTKGKAGHDGTLLSQCWGGGGRRIPETQWLTSPPNYRASSPIERPCLKNKVDKPYWGMPPRVAELTPLHPTPPPTNTYLVGLRSHSFIVLYITLMVWIHIIRNNAKLFLVPSESSYSTSYLPFLMFPLMNCWGNSQDIKFLMHLFKISIKGDSGKSLSRVIS